MSSKTDLKALDTLLASRGWAIIKERMDREVIEAALAIGKTVSMSMDEVHFRRGSIWAAQQLLVLPERLKAIIQSEMPFTAPEITGLKPDDATKAPPLQQEP